MAAIGESRWMMRSRKRWRKRPERKSRNPPMDSHRSPMKLLAVVSVLSLLCVAADSASPAAQPKFEPPAPRKRAEIEAVIKAGGAPLANPRPIKILLVAGPKDHGKGEHDYPAWQKAWAPLLAKSANVTIDTAFPWPITQQWDGVDLAVFYLKTKWDAGQLAEIKKLQDRGAGVVTIHWAIGCDQDWDKHAERFGLSYKAASYRHGNVSLKLVTDHPILHGFPKELQFVDEPYWPLIGDNSKVQVLAVSQEMTQRGDDRKKNPGDDRVEAIPVFWTHEAN